MSGRQRRGILLNRKGVGLRWQVKQVMDMRMRGLRPSRVFLVSRQTGFGSMYLAWSEWRGEPKVLRIVLSRPGRPADRAVGVLFPTALSVSCARITSLADRLEAFLGGEDVRFSLDLIRLDLCSTFQQRVLRAEHGIPRGFLSTYKLIANHVARPSAARAVGRALAANPFPLMIPCHRAIRSDRRLGGYQGGIAMKRALLEAEGIGFDEVGRVHKENPLSYGSQTRARSRGTNRA